MEQLDRIEQKVDKIHDKLDEHLVACEKRTTALEVKVGAFVWVVCVVGTGVVGLILKGCVL